MSIEKFVPQSPDKFIRNSKDFEVARFGHLNELVSCINATGASGIAGAVQFSNGSALASNAENLFWNNTTCSLNATKLSVTSLTCGQAVCAGVSGQLQTYTPASGAFQSINSNTNIIPLSSWSNSIPLGSPSSTYNVILGGCLNLICTNSDPGYFVPLDSSSILGGSNNILLSGKGSSIVTGCSNLISSAYFATISGGRSNSACYANYGFIGGGRSNCIRYNTWGTISGGYLNKICSLSGFGIEASFIGGGQFNNIACGNNSVIVGGKQNTINVPFYKENNAIVAGYNNCICSLTNDSFIGGGAQNFIADSCFSIVTGGSGNGHSCGLLNFIGGGQLNRIYSSGGATISGGCYNCIGLCGTTSVISGGSGNCMDCCSEYSSIGGGSSNLHRVSRGGVIAGGSTNRVVGCNIIGGTCSVSYNAIGGGTANCISKSQSSTISGGYINAILATNIGATNATGCNFNGILGGQRNCILDKCSTFIVGSCITADRDCATFVNNLSIKNIPTSSAGLPAGSVWNDGGFLKIV